MRHLTRAEKMAPLITHVRDTRKSILNYGLTKSDDALVILLFTISHFMLVVKQPG